MLTRRGSSGHALVPGVMKEEMRLKKYLVLSQNTSNKQYNAQFSLKYESQDLEELS